jgi:hypothetical protein
MISEEELEKLGEVMCDAQDAYDASPSPENLAVMLAAEHERKEAFSAWYAAKFHPYGKRPSFYGR